MKREDVESRALAVLHVTSLCGMLDVWKYL